DGQEIVLGDVALRVLHTPGHRPEHCCFSVIDRTRAEEPWLVLTGDSLFVGDAARPDLAVEAVDGARELYESLQRLLELPDGVEVFPGHVAGSLRGASNSPKASTTIRFERRFNLMLTVGSEEEFVSESALTRSRFRRPSRLRAARARDRDPTRRRGGRARAPAGRGRGGDNRRPGVARARRRLHSGQPQHPL